MINQLFLLDVTESYYCTYLIEPDYVASKITWIKAILTLAIMIQIHSVKLNMLNAAGPILT